jgi:hypothetical protein
LACVISTWQFFGRDYHNQSAGLSGLSINRRAQGRRLRKDRIKLVRRHPEPKEGSRFPSLAEPGETCPGDLFVFFGRRKARIDAADHFLTSILR